MRKFIPVVAVAILCAACSTAQLTAAQSDISTGIADACKDVLASAAVATAAAPANNKVAAIAGYATGACTLAGPVAALVQNSATLQWLGSLQGQLSAAAAPATATTAAKPAA